MQMSTRSKKPTSATLSGYLVKKGGMRKNWLERWFEVKDGQLRYFDKVPGPCKGVIDLSDAQDIRASTAPSAKGAEIEIQTAERTWRLRAPSLERREEWLAVLKLEAGLSQPQHRAYEPGAPPPDDGWAPPPSYNQGPPPGAPPPDDGWGRAPPDRGPPPGGPGPYQASAVASAKPPTTNSRLSDKDRLQLKAAAKAAIEEDKKDERAEMVLAGLTCAAMLVSI